MTQIQTKIEVTRTQEIIDLHNQIGNYLKSSLENAIIIGGLLVDQKESLQHGEFTAWVNDNLPFTDRTARSYMNVYRERDLLKTENVSVLSEGYRLLTERTGSIAGTDFLATAVYYLEIAIKETPGILERTVDEIEQATENSQQARRYTRLLLDEWREVMDKPIDNVSDMRELSIIAKKSFKLQNLYSELNLRTTRELGTYLCNLPEEA